MNDLGVVQAPVFRVIAPIFPYGTIWFDPGPGGGRFAIIGEHLDHPGYPDLVLLVDQGGRVGLVGHASSKGGPAAAGLVGHHVEGEVGQQGAVVVLVPHRDAVNAQLVLIDHVPPLTAIRDIGDGGAGWSVISFSYDHEMFAVGPSSHRVPPQCLHITVRDTVEGVDHLTASAAASFCDFYPVDRAGVLKVKADFELAAAGVGRLLHPDASLNPGVLVKRVRAQRKDINPLRFDLDLCQRPGERDGVPELFIGQT